MRSRKLSSWYDWRLGLAAAARLRRRSGAAPSGTSRRSAALERCRALLGMAVCIDRPEPPTLRCPACSGIMLVVERLTQGQLYFGAGLAPSLPKRFRDDTS